MELNPANTYAFIIAVGKYPDENELPPLPQTFKNAEALNNVLMDSIGIPKENIIPAIDPDNTTKLVAEIDKLASKEDAKTIIVYYAGHGLPHDNSYFLTLTNSTVRQIHINGLSIDYLCQGFVNNKNLKIVLIIDSCFSEEAFEKFTARNYLVIASSAKNEPTKYPVDEDFSAFTSELINIFKNGIEDGDEYLTWKDVYIQLKKNLEQKGFPRPRISSQNEVDTLQIVRNNFNKESFDAEWIMVIKEEMGQNNDKFSNSVRGIIDAGGVQMEKKLQEHLVKHFPFPIAYDLNKIFIPGKITSDSYFKLYKSIIRFLFMVGFIDYERVKKTEGFKSGDNFIKLFPKFNKPDHDFCYSMLEALSTDFRDNKSKRFLEEFDYFDPGFQSVIQNLELQMKQEDTDLKAVISNIINLISRLDFLLDYKLISVKDVNLSYRKYDPIFYKHVVSMLQGNEPTQYVVWNQADEEWQQSFIKNTEAKNSQSVLFVKCKDLENIDYLNLWPMIIDKSALDPTANTAKIYIYAGKDEKEKYQYKDIMEKEDNGTISYELVESKESNTAAKKKKINELFSI